MTVDTVTLSNLPLSEKREILAFCNRNQMAIDDSNPRKYRYITRNVSTSEYRLDPLARHDYKSNQTLHAIETVNIYVPVEALFSMKYRDDMFESMREYSYDERRKHRGEDRTTFDIHVAKQLLDKVQTKSREDRLRAKYATVQEAYEQYQFVLDMYDKGEGEE